MPAKKAPPAGEILDPFGPTSPAVQTTVPPKVDQQALIAKLTQLQKDAQAADRERATAEAQLAQAKKDQKEIDDQLKALGVDPEKAEEALAQLERDLAAQTEQAEAVLAAERQVYQQILTASRG
jgi:septal ring factor EnvC (AmiA/AmiB activator)